ncbi:beta-ketoacyl-ACP synthase III [Paludibacterium paludis]|uniref:Beta-ketoacyl-[acyl-carrier-protein] synthase III n=1 Tax=Paludibacterium paludis TaxID=1225769 RepID=A0A918U8K9_9NEIS|nr:beta-ketoacyl-ACP synthase III [Paludibacterium paludis]GGY10500.1 3-oxoacyl-[acyl-carrier-protein] synthase 3 [Paludibacterium paludis]
MVHSRILGTGSFLPANVVTNAMLAERVDTSDEWIVSRTGIRSRRIADDQDKTSDLALRASREAIARAGISPADIDLIIVATTTPDMVFPSTACLLQEKLGIHGCPAFDVQAVCSGFIYALTTAHNYIKSGMARTALVVGAEIISRILDWEDRRTSVLFGDGAGAVILGASDSPGILHAKLAADGRYKDILNTPAQIAGGKIQGLPYLNMDGPAVFKFAVKALSDIASRTLAEAGMPQSRLDWLVPHQANLRIIEATARHLGLPMERVVVTLPEQGNTSAASIPLALDAAVRDGRIQPGQTILLEGIGGGFAWGAVLLEI